ncbi:MAG: methylmalonyl-CoA mutase [Calditrichaeota bacterium]|nr:methylmalonyl-CoA mutase [Calditrichota bacterium]MBT7787737.1 methylmalonyl-CoA mutase [Calditrichota bacterium]
MSERTLNFVDEKPGNPPYTRGVYPEMYKKRLWTMRQYAGYATATESNARYRLMLEQGQTGISVAFDLPTQIGYDSDDPMAGGEVGKVGVAIDSLEDMEQLFDHIPLDKVSTSMTINATAPILLAMYVALARKHNISPSELRGTVQNDILKEYIARGTYIYPPQPSMRLIVDLMRYCHAEVPLWNTISISGYHIREAGSTAVQEIAYTLADGIAYVKAAVEAGLDIDDFGPRLSFFFNSHLNLFEEVAKFRAARRLWCKIMRDKLGAINPKSWMLRFHTQTAGSSLTAQQPEVNIVRTTLEALAAVLGGTQSLHTNSYDEALGLPTEHTARIALRTQQVIGFESGVADEPDPLFGSVYIEQLTDKLETEAMDEINRIEEMGGAVKAVELNYFQNAIARSAYQYQKQIDAQERVVVGVNKFALEDEEKTEIMKISLEAENDQVKKLKTLRLQRDNIAVKESLTRLKIAAGESTSHLMEPILSAVEAYCTIGEISNALREVWGEYGKRL